MKKLLLGIGLATTILTPVVTVISCGSSNVGTHNTTNKIKTEKKALDAQKKLDAEAKLKKENQQYKKESLTKLFEEFMKHSVANMGDAVHELEGSGSLAGAKGIDSIKEKLLNNKGIFAFVHDILASGMGSAVGTEATFVQKIKDRFNKDLSTSPFLPLIKGILFGFKDLENLHIDPIKISGLTIDVEKLIKDISKHGIMYAMSQDRTLSLATVVLPFIKEFSETGTLKNKDDLDKMKLFYGADYVQYTKSLRLKMGEFDNAVANLPKTSIAGLTIDGTKDVNDASFTKANVLKLISNITGMSPLRNDHLEITREVDKMFVEIESLSGGSTKITLTGFKALENAANITNASSLPASSNDETTKHVIELSSGIPTTGGVFASIFRDGIVKITKNNLIILQEFLGKIAKSKGLLDIIFPLIFKSSGTGSTPTLLEKISPAFVAFINLLGIEANSGNQEISSLIFSMINGGIANVKLTDLATILRMIREISISHSSSDIQYIPKPTASTTHDEFMALLNMPTLASVPVIKTYLHDSDSVTMQALAPALFAAIDANNKKFIDLLKPSGKDLKVATSILEVMKTTSIVGEISSFKIIEIITYFYNILKDITAKYKIKLPITFGVAVGILEGTLEDMSVKKLIEKFYSMIFSLI
ncbi:MAG: hypothetical protein KAG14_02995 [Mycoplasmataceae bacterium]|nr:hypothetical protein [Mycoplasmataceae bacterium]